MPPLKGSRAGPVPSNSPAADPQLVCIHPCPSTTRTWHSSKALHCTPGGSPGQWLHCFSLAHPSRHLAGAGILLHYPAMLPLNLIVDGSPPLQPGYKPIFNIANWISKEISKLCGQQKSLKITEENDYCSECISISKSDFYPV